VGLVEGRNFSLPISQMRLSHSVAHGPLAFLCMPYVADAEGASLKLVLCAAAARENTSSSCRMEQTE
jgi:hypothetical protein